MKNILAIQSHVVYGHAGNSAAEFPMRRLGANVWPLNTVQFSNHTQYGKWTGCVMPPSHLTEIVQGIAAIDKLHTCDFCFYSRGCRKTKKSRLSSRYSSEKLYPYFDWRTAN